MLAFQVKPDTHYHAVWCWVQDGVQVVAAVYREPDGIWRLSMLSSVGDGEHVWSKEGDVPPAERARLLESAYDAAKIGTAKVGSPPPSTPVKIDLDCDGKKAVQVLQGLARLNRLPKGVGAN